jgi:xanthosine utilization system XapX-like protein
MFKLHLTARRSISINPWLLASVLLVGSAARAQTVRIDFEDIQTGARGSGGQVRIARQYERKGLILNDAFLLDYSKTGTPNFAHSGTRAIEQCYGIEFCETPFELTFTSAQSRLKVWAGYSEGIRGSAAVRLEVFDQAGKPLKATQAKLDTSNASRIQTPLEIKLDDSLIWRAKVSITGTPISGFALDDIEFEAVALLPDLVPQDVTHRADGDLYFIDARVENVGRRASPPTVLEIVSEGHTARADVPKLDPKQSLPVAVKVAWTLGTGAHAFSVSLDPDRRIQEEREDNNASSHTIEVATKPVAVPPVVGRPLGNARAMIERAGLATGGQLAGLDAVKAIVRSQSPGAGALVLPGSVVTIRAEEPKTFPWWVALPVAGLLAGAVYLRIKPPPPIPPTIAVEGVLGSGSAEIDFAKPMLRVPEISFRFEAGMTQHQVIEDNPKGESAQ